MKKSITCILLAVFLLVGTIGTTAQAAMKAPKISIDNTSQGYSLDVTWTKIKGATGYQLYVKEDQGWSEKINTKERVYYWYPGAHTTGVKFKVRAYKKNSSGKKVYGKWSKWKRGA